MKEIDINLNSYNSSIDRSEPKYKIWSSAGIMLTYWCSAACKCCYVYCGPEAGDAQTEMAVETALQCWRDIRRLAGGRGLVHLTGGEPFGDYPRLREILRLAQQENLQGLEKIETNAYWCNNEEIVRERLSELKHFGLTKLHISTDVYHQEFVPIENVKMLVDIGREILGPDNLQIRWQDYYENPILTDGMTIEQKFEVYKQHYQLRKERMLGRATEELYGVLELKELEFFRQFNCRRSLLGAKHIHIDGAGNVFSGTCAGIIIGNIYETGGLYNLWLNYNIMEHPVFSVLAQAGPMGLLEKYANKADFKEKYADKCHLCYEIRRYLYRRGDLSSYIGPGVCYGCGNK